MATRLVQLSVRFPLHALLYYPSVVLRRTLVAPTHAIGRDTAQGGAVLFHALAAPKSAHPLCLHILHAQRDRSQKDTKVKKNPIKIVSSLLSKCDFSSFDYGKWHQSYERMI